MIARWLLVAAVAIPGCNRDYDFIFPGRLPDVPAVLDLGTIEPVDFANLQEFRDAAVYAEIGPTGGPELGGVTFSFEGYNGPICVFVDPELASWIPSVSNQQSAFWSYPDNPFDDGDLDVRGGLSVYYTGVPGERVGNFEIRYSDALDNTVQLDFAECTPVAAGNSTIPKNNFGGKGHPEYCEVSTSVQGSRYTVLLEGFSAPIDDNRLAFGVVVARRSCAQIVGLAGSTAGSLPAEFANDEELIALAPNQGLPGLVEGAGLECLLYNEGIIPQTREDVVLPDSGVRVDVSRLDETGRLVADDGSTEDPIVPIYKGSTNPPPVWEGSELFQKAYCTGRLRQFCRREAQAVADGDLTCAWEFNAATTEGTQRCFCGDQSLLP